MAWSNNPEDAEMEYLADEHDRTTNHRNLTGTPEAIAEANYILSHIASRLIVEAILAATRDAAMISKPETMQSVCHIDGMIDGFLAASPQYGDAPRLYAIGARVSPDIQLFALLISERARMPPEEGADPTEIKTTYTVLGPYGAREDSEYHEIGEGCPWRLTDQKGVRAALAGTPVAAMADEFLNHNLNPDGSIPDLAVGIALAR